MSNETFYVNYIVKIKIVFFVINIFLSINILLFNHIEVFIIVNIFKCHILVLY